MIYSAIDSFQTTRPSAWTHRLAENIFPGQAAPFTWSVLRTPVESALRRASEALGAPPPAERLWQLGTDHSVRLNAAAVAEIDDALGGAAWLGAQPPVSRGGWLARLKNSGTERRVQACIANAPAETTALRQRLLAWFSQVRGLRWTQADLLQVMEELEPQAASALTAYFLTRAGLHAASAEVAERLDAKEAALGALYAGLDGFPTVAAAYALPKLTGGSRGSSDAEAILHHYGHRGPGEMQVNAFRWGNSPGLFAHLPTQMNWTADNALHTRQALEAELRGRNAVGWRRAEASLSNARALMRATDEAWDAIVIVMAAAQAWLMAAGKEALAGALLTRATDALYLELEELKQVATGEWHGGRSNAVQDEVDRRRAALAVAVPIKPSHDAPVGVNAGQASGSAYCDSPAHSAPPAGAIWLAEWVDPGAAPFWQAAAAIVGASPDVWAPGMITARVLGLPAVAGAAEASLSVQTGDPVWVDGAAGVVRLDAVV